MLDTRVRVLDTRVNVLDTRVIVLDNCASVLDTRVSVLDTRASVLRTRASVLGTRAGVVYMGLRVLCLGLRNRGSVCGGRTCQKMVPIMTPCGSFPPHASQQTTGVPRSQEWLQERTRNTPTKGFLWSSSPPHAGQQTVLNMASRASSTPSSVGHALEWV